ncbi:MAG: DUF1311 domain-containing protein [Magnetococcales bacterium]|nr:DUF1311 domain-containing protein [Magnetococcales bacterium]
MAWLAPAPGDASSFDCAKARHPHEKIICADKELSALDERIAQLYQSARHQLSEEGRTILLDGQRQWIRFTRAVCSPKGKKREEVKKCLQRSFQERKKPLGKAALKKGPYLFSNVVVFEFHPVPFDKSGQQEMWGYYPGYYPHIFSYPRIDAPLTPAAIAFNRAFTIPEHSNKSCDSKNGDLSLDYEVLGASGAIISIFIEDWTYCHGAPHGFGGAYARNFITHETGLRDLRDDDLFLLNTPWKEFVYKECADFLNSSEKGQNRSPFKPDEFKHHADNPLNWFPSRKGLLILISAGTVGGYAEGPLNVTIPWDKLKLFLAPDVERLILE